MFKKVGDLQPLVSIYKASDIVVNKAKEKMSSLLNRVQKELKNQVKEDDDAQLSILPVEDKEEKTK